MGFWPVTKRVIKDAELVLIILDARMPELSINKELERVLEYYQKPYVYVFNKIDLVSEEALKKLKSEYKNAFFVSGTKNIDIGLLKRGLLIELKRMKSKENLIGVVGYPNTGKSAVINALAKSDKAKVSRIAGTTRGMQWINAGALRVIDSPGVVPFEDREIKLAVLGAKNPEKLKDPIKAVFEMIRTFKKTNKESFRINYGIEDIEGMDEQEIFWEIGRRKGFLKKGGEVDENRTAMTILRDWQAGKLKV